MDAKGCSCDDLEAVIGETCDGEVALDTATRVQHLCVGDRPYWLIHLIVGDAL